MRQYDWKHAYGQPPSEFHQGLCQTLRTLSEQELSEQEQVSGSHAKSLLLIAILILALLAGVAFAVNQLNLLKYLYEDQPPVEDSSAILTNFDTTVSNDMLTVSVEEALFDGKGLILTIRYRLNDAQHYYFGESFVSEGAEHPMPNATALYPWPPSVLINGSEYGKSWTWTIEPDGSMLYYAGVLVSLPKGTQSIDVTINNHLGGELNLENMNLVLHVRTSLRHATVLPVESEQCERFAIASAQLTLNSVLSYLDVEYSYQQASAGEEMGIVIWVYDANGARIEEVNLSSEICRSLENGNFLSTISLPYFKELPETLYLEAKVIGDAVTLGRIECQVIPWESDEPLN